MKFFPNKEGSVYALLVAFCLAYGYGFHNGYEHPLTNLRLFAAFLVMAAIFAPIFGLAMKQLKKHRDDNAVALQDQQEKKWLKIIKPRNMLTALILLIGWLPYWLAAYPGFFTYDATNAFIQHFYGIEYSTHHPLIHSILIGDVFKLMLRFMPDNYNAGIVALSWLTMLMGAAVFTYMCDHIYRISNRAVYVISVVYLAFFPTIGLFASCSTKDTFTAFWMILFAVKMLKTIDMGIMKNKRADHVLLICFICVMLLYRKNILIAYVLFLPLFFLIVKKHRIRWGIIFAAGLCGYLVGNSALELRYHPAHGAVGEMLCVPLQQMARVYVSEGDEMFTQEELELFNRIHPYSLREYNELNADDIKHDMDDTLLREHMTDFFKMWIRIGAHHPVEYTEAFLVNTYQAWYPFCNITGYARRSESKYTYFKCDVEDPGQLDSKLPTFYDFLKKLSEETSLYEIPVVGILFTIGFYVMVLLFVLLYGIYVKSRQMRIFASFMLAVTFTAMCGPLVLPRYYIYLYYTFPMMLGFIFQKKVSGHE